MSNNDMGNDVGPYSHVVLSAPESPIAYHGLCRFREEGLKFKPKALVVILGTGIGAAPP